MEKSIETIWKEGFLKNDAMIAPKVNDLYNQKSKNIISRIERLLKWNIIGIYIFAIGFTIFGFITGIPVLLILLIAVLFVTVGVYTQFQMKGIDAIDRNLNTYQYLKSFDDWLKKQIKRNITLSRFFYPVSFFSACLIVWFSDKRLETIEKLLSKYPDMIMVGNVPLFFILGVALVCTLMSIFADKIYKLDAGIIYGRVFKKLKEIIKDLEELRK